MKEWLILAFIFFIGSLAGWLLELIFRRFFSRANPSRKWINPGFLVGPYLPLYGFSLCVVYLLAHINVSFIHGVYLRKTVLFLLMALSVTLIEYFAGLIFIKGMHVKLWDYSDEKFNEQLKVVLKNQISQTGFSKDIVDSIKFSPINCKKVLVKHYDTYVDTTVGSFLLEGNPLLLQYLYDVGMGSRNTMFGYLDLLTQDL